MALFGNPDKKCILCGKSPGSHKHPAANGRFLCDKCAVECGYEKIFFSLTPVEKITPERVQRDHDNHIQRIEDNKIAYKEFKPTVKFDKLIFFDTAKLEFYTPDTLLANTKTPIVYKYDQVIDCDVIVAEGSLTQTISTTRTKSGIGKAVMGGILFGGIGALSGAAASNSKSSGMSTSREIKVANELTIQIKTNDISHPIVTVSLLDKELKVDSKKFQKIKAVSDDIFKIFKAIADNNRGIFDVEDDDTVDADTAGLVDEIRKYKSLMDQGIITEEEFSEKKKQLLGL